MFRAGNQQNSLYIMRKTNQSVLGTLCSSTACEGVLGTKPQVHFLPGKFTFARCLRPKPIIHQRINPSPTSQPNIPAQHPSPRSRKTQANRGRACWHLAGPIGQCRQHVTIDFWSGEVKADRRCRKDPLPIISRYPNECVGYL